MRLNDSLLEKLRIGDEAACLSKIANGDQVNVSDIDGWTALHYAAYNGYLAVCDALLAHDAQINAKDNWNRTPLHNAVYGANADVCELLLPRGAQVDAKDNEGKTPLTIALENGHANICLHLLNSGAHTENVQSAIAHPIYSSTHPACASLVKIWLVRNHDLNALSDEKVKVHPKTSPSKGTR